jgi:hypothetical protein
VKVTGTVAPNKALDVLWVRIESCLRFDARSARQVFDTGGVRGWGVKALEDIPGEECGGEDLPSGVRVPYSCVFVSPPTSAGHSWSTLERAPGQRKGSLGQLD